MKRKRLLCFMTVLFMLVSGLQMAVAAEKPLYTADTYYNCALRAKPADDADIVGGIPKNTAFDVYEVGSEYVKAGYKGQTGYVKRTGITNVTPVDPESTPPYGVFKHAYIAVTGDVTPVLHTPDEGAEAYVTLQAGARLSILDITDGWARVPYWRSYGYVDTRQLKDLTPVSPTDAPISKETPIAAFTSFYSVKDTKSNIGRMNNIVVACGRLTRTIGAHEGLDFNRQVGPYKKSLGYMDAPVLIDGEVVPGVGGGTCQVSSTLYNTVLQLPHIAIVYRRPHGNSGAYYLPHGVDAAVGNDSLNFVISNDYDFPIRVEASAQDGALFICIYRQ